MNDASQYGTHVTSHTAAVHAVAATVGPGVPIHRYSAYLQRRFGARTYRVAVDAGFTCPVRESGYPCTYCDARGSRAPYLGEVSSLAAQIAGGRAFLNQRYGATRFLLYFQAFSNTHAPVDVLRGVYDAALEEGPFVGLIVATRPDCMDEPRAALLAEYRRRGLDLWVELGLQSACDATLRRVHRGHGVAEFDRAVRLLKDHRILVAAHVILGLPGESPGDVVHTALHLSRLGIDGVKFHNLVVPQGTPMYRDYRMGRITPPEPAAYRELLIGALEQIASTMIVMRLTFDPPRGIRSAPEHWPDKAAFYRDLTREMDRRGTWQGKLLDTRGPTAVP